MHFNAFAAKLTQFPWSCSIPSHTATRYRDMQDTVSGQASLAVLREPSCKLLASGWLHQVTWMHTTRCMLCLLCFCQCSSILPIPFAVSKTGVLVGCLTMLLVSWANDATSCMLIKAAAATGKPTYEALAEWAGGKPWKVRRGETGGGMLISGPGA